MFVTVTLVICWKVKNVGFEKADNAIAIVSDSKFINDW